MSKQRYYQLINEICSRCNIPNPQSMYENCNLTVGGIPVTLAYVGSVNQGNIISFCDFGVPPELDHAAVLRRVLEANMFLLGVKTTHFAINPETGHILLLAKISLDGLTSGDLLRTISMHASAAQQWRKSHEWSNVSEDMAKLSSNVSVASA